MRQVRLNALVVISAALLLSAVAALTLHSQNDYGVTPARDGVIDGMATVNGSVTLNVTITGQTAQPSDPKLSTGVAKPSDIMTFSDDKTRILAGMPVSLVIEKSGAVWTPYIGVVESIVDGRRCVVKVDTEALKKTWRDPSDGNLVHKAGDYLHEGAKVSIMAASN